MSQATVRGRFTGLVRENRNRFAQLLTHRPIGHLPARSASSLWPLHEAPVSGVVYDLQCSIGASLAYRVLTTHQNATVPASMSSGWAGKSVLVDLVSAKLLNNEVA